MFHHRWTQWPSVLVQVFLKIKVEIFKDEIEFILTMYNILKKNDILMPEFLKQSYFSDSSTRDSLICMLESDLLQCHNLYYDEITIGVCQWNYRNLWICIFDLPRLFPYLLTYRRYHMYLHRVSQVSHSVDRILLNPMNSWRVYQEILGYDGLPFAGLVNY